MQQQCLHVKINIAEMKAEIVKKLGSERSKQYFHYLTKFLSLKLHKTDFDKLCIRIIGRENIPLHNQFIRSILRNACTSKNPSLTSHNADVLRYGNQLSSKDIPADAYQNESRVNMTQASGSPGLSNGGNMLLISPQNARSGDGDRLIGELGNAVGPNGKSSFASDLSTSACPSEFDNGNLNLPQIGRSVQQHQQGLMHPSEKFNEISFPQPAKVSVGRKQSDSSLPFRRKDHSATTIRDDGIRVSSSVPHNAPLGLPFYPISIGGANRSLPPSGSRRSIGTCIDDALLDSLTLKQHMEQTALGHGLEGVSVDCANILNRGLDSYLKGLIMACIELVGSRSGHDLTRNNTHKLYSHTKLNNGTGPDHQYQMIRGSQLFDVNEQRTQYPISLQDFKVAIGLNPRQLGEDWPVLLEKICIDAFEE